MLLALAASLFTPVFAQETPEINVPTEPSSIEETVEVATTTEPFFISTTSEATLAEATFIEPLVQAPEATVELIVKLEDDANINLSSGRSELKEVTEAVGAVIEEHLPEANSAVISVDANANVEEVLARLENSSSVEYAEPNYPRTFEALIPTDTRFTDSWALQNTGQTVSGTAGTAGADIDATLAWDLSLGTSTVVAVIDNGVLYTHPDLLNNLWDGTSCVSETGAALGNCEHGYDFKDNDLSPLPQATSTTDTYHGTHVAGIIAAEMNNATGTVGVAPKTEIMALRFGLDVASEVKAIDFAIQNGAKIINASFGGSQFSQAEYDAIARFRDAGGIFITAAGNGGQDQIGDDTDSAPIYPGSYDLANIVNVAATGQDDEIASFSNFGDVTVDMGAPGRRILSTIALDGVTATYAYLSGTSMAAPHAAGTAALLKSLYPSASTTALKSALLNSGDSIAALSGTTVTGRRLNAFSALQYLASDLVAPVITLIGSASVSLTVGDSYTEAGATALDDIDGSVPVVIGGDTVNTSTPGTYTVTYNATDAAGNHALQVTRTVTVSAAPEEPRRRSGGGGGGGGGSRTKSVDNPARELFTPATSPYASMTPEQRAALLKVLLELLAKLQAQLAILQARGL